MTELAILPTTSLRSRSHALASAASQIALLESPDSELPFFNELLSERELAPLVSDRIDTLQVNLGKLCNMTCRHCHVDAGPDRREVMSRETLDACLRLLETANIGTLDLTGGAPEMNPHFCHAVETAFRLGRHVIDRCNLTILTLPRYEHLPEFLAEHRVEIVASLPCYLQDNVNRQRGDRAFERSIEALRTLNGLGYGTEGTGLSLTLVYNPVGPSLPPGQAKLEADYREHLRTRYDIEFTRLFTITNMPIGRFLEDLHASGRYEEYMQRLVSGFNPAAASGVMCRNTLSVGWNGALYDCDFNQMLELPVRGPQTIFDCDEQSLRERAIRTGRHCFGCTAGAGSGCQGATVERG
jgi:radical SAM/Cys-rich protein